VTVIVDDAGSGDLLFGVVISAYRSEGQCFRYDVIDVQYFQPPMFKQKEYLKQASNIVFSLLDKLGLRADEHILICTSYLFDEACEELRRMYGAERVQRAKVVGEAQCFTEMAYLDELRNLGYEPLEGREGKRSKSFFHMMRWLSRNPHMVRYAKTGWPRLYRYRLFRQSTSPVS